ncbi:MAG TPA: hypothetical protein VLF91_06485 [Candidatus Saccharimonadales bacterium]|nr:hypothetical protein [Candidatus Saccharimonadales bacterium]
MSLGGENDPAAAHSILQAVAEQLKVPLTVIARQAELSQLAGATETLHTNDVHVQAVAALQLVDSYLLGLQLAREQTALELEPVSVSALLTDTAHSIAQFAAQYEVDVQVHIAGKYEPVMAHARGLRAALLSLSFAVAEAMAARQATSRRELMLAVHRTPHGIVTGLYGANQLLEAGQWRTALKLCGRAFQPFTGLAAGSGAGLFVADAILQSMNTRLRVGHFEHHTGLAATFQPSRQLQFV